MSFPPSCTQAAPERLNTHAAPWSPLSPGSPTSAVLPSADRATLAGGYSGPISSPLAAKSPACTLHVEPERMNTDARPALLGVAMSAVLPSAESATLLPNPTALHPPHPGAGSTSARVSPYCRVQAEPERAKIQRVPDAYASYGPP